MKHYVKIDVNLPYNPKIGKLTDAEHRVWIDLLCYAGQTKDHGRTGIKMKNADWVFRPRDDVKEIIMSLMRNELILLQNLDETGCNALQQDATRCATVCNVAATVSALHTVASCVACEIVVANYDEYQSGYMTGATRYATDENGNATVNQSTLRSRRSREISRLMKDGHTKEEATKKANETHATPCNADATLMQQDATRCIAYLDKDIDKDNKTLTLRCDDENVLAESNKSAEELYKKIKSKRPDLQLNEKGFKNTQAIADWMQKGVSREKIEKYVLAKILKIPQGGDVGGWNFFKKTMQVAIDEVQEYHEFERKKKKRSIDFATFISSKPNACQEFFEKLEQEKGADWMVSNIHNAVLDVQFTEQQSMLGVETFRTLLITHRFSPGINKEEELINKIAKECGFYGVELVIKK